MSSLETFIDKDGGLILNYSGFGVYARNIKIIENGILK